LRLPGSHKANFTNPFGKIEEENPMPVPVFAGPGDVVIFSEGMMHGAYPVTNNIIRRSVYFCYMPSINRDNLPQQRMSMYPDHVLERLSDRVHLLTAPGYI
jgi:ectoine hydroxylase-related dioxygenase (phytanoyl-CoA dioxygenase family)|tara:strand:- start:157 stop:459 length:303 start_codon:yes stop_codon:yes gene_type:complete